MEEFSRSLKLMGNNFTTTVVAVAQAEAFIDTR